MRWRGRFIRPQVRTSLNHTSVVCRQHRDDVGVHSVPSGIPGGGVAQLPASPAAAFSATTSPLRRSSCRAASVQFVIRHVFRVVAVVQLRPKEVVLRHQQRETGLASKSSNHVVWTCTSACRRPRRIRRPSAIPQQATWPIRGRPLPPIRLGISRRFRRPVGSRGQGLTWNTGRSRRPPVAGPVRGVAVVGVGQIAGVNPGITTPGCATARSWASSAAGELPHWCA